MLAQTIELITKEINIAESKKAIVRRHHITVVGIVRVSRADTDDQHQERRPRINITILSLYISLAVGDCNTWLSPLLQ